MNAAHRVGGGWLASATLGLTLMFSCADTQPDDSVQTHAEADDRRDAASDGTQGTDTTSTKPAGSTSEHTDGATAPNGTGPGSTEPAESEVTDASSGRGGSSNLTLLYDAGVPQGAGGHPSSVVDGSVNSDGTSLEPGDAAPPPAVKVDHFPYWEAGLPPGYSERLCRINANYRPESCFLMVNCDDGHVAASCTAGDGGSYDCECVDLEGTVLEGSFSGSEIEPCERAYDRCIEVIVGSL